MTRLLVVSCGGTPRSCRWQRDLDSRRPLLDAAESCERHARLLEAQRVSAESQKKF
jgi:hypothetical protein